MGKHGDYSRQMSAFSKRILRALWVWAEGLTWEEVQFRGVQCLLFVLAVGLIYLLMGIGSYHAAAVATDQMQRYQGAFELRVGDRIERLDRRAAESEARLLAIDSALNDGARAAYAQGLPPFHVIPVGQLAALVQNGRRQERIDRARERRVVYALWTEGD